MDTGLPFVITATLLTDIVIQAYPMPVASHMDSEISCLIRLIGMCIPNKHMLRGSDDPLYRAPPWDEYPSQIFVFGFSYDISALADQYTFSKRVST